MAFDLVTLRGLAENMIDNQLTDENLTDAHRFFEVLEPSVENRVDAVYGFIIGQIIAILNTTYVMQFSRPLNNEENGVVAKAMENRLLKIKSRIRDTFT